MSKIAFNSRVQVGSFYYEQIHDFLKEAATKNGSFFDVKVVWFHYSKI